jgi:hypothetical protein
MEKLNLFIKYYSNKNFLDGIKIRQRKAKLRKNNISLATINYLENIEKNLLNNNLTKFRKIIFKSILNKHKFNIINDKIPFLQFTTEKS